MTSEQHESAAAPGYTRSCQCAQIAYTVALKYLNRDYFKAKEYAIWVHGPSGL